MLEFRLVDQLDTVLCVYQTPRQRPTAMHKYSPTLLGYLDVWKDPRKVHWLDCTSNPAIPSSRPTYMTKERHVYDICIVKENEKHLLITTDPKTLNMDSLTAYNLDTGLVEWSISGKVGDQQKDIWPRRVCTDGNGHIFFSDYNYGRIIMVSAKGAVMSTIVNMWQLGMGKPEWLSWNKCANSLVAVGQRTVGQGTYINSFKITL